MTKQYQVDLKSASMLACFHLLQESHQKFWILKLFVSKDSTCHWINPFEPVSPVVLFWFLLNFWFLFPGFVLVMVLFWFFNVRNYYQENELAYVVWRKKFVTATEILGNSWFCSNILISQNKIMKYLSVQKTEIHNSADTRNQGFSWNTDVYGSS